MSKNIGRPAVHWKNHTVRVNLPALSLSREDLRQVFRLLQTKSDEVRAYYMEQLRPMDGETEKDYEIRRNNVFNAFVVSVTIHSFNGEFLTANNEEVFEDISLPKRLRSILLSTESVPNAILNATLSRKIVLFLDFSQPLMFDVSRLPSLATANETNFAVDSDDESWFSSSSHRLGEFFKDRRASHNFIHIAGLYDVLLFLVGLPSSIWFASKVATLFDRYAASAVIQYSICVYAFFLGLFTFRLLFSYARWVLPKVDIKGQSPSVAHRMVLGVVILGLAVDSIWTLVATIF